MSQQGSSCKLNQLLVASAERQPGGQTRAKMAADASRRKRPLSNNHSTTVLLFLRNKRQTFSLDFLETSLHLREEMHLNEGVLASGWSQTGGAFRPTGGAPLRI